MVRYVAILSKDPESDYGVDFPDFPGCVTAGRTIEEAKELALEALLFHIAGMIEDGLPVPEPTALDDLALDWEADHVIEAFLVSVGDAGVVRSGRESRPEEQIAR